MQLGDVTIDGLTKTEDLMRKLAKTVEHLDHLETLIRAMRSGNEHTSTMLFARLRLGASVEALAQSIHSDNGADIFEDATCSVSLVAVIEAHQQHRTNSGSRITLDFKHLPLSPMHPKAVVNFRPSCVQLHDRHVYF